VKPLNIADDRKPSPQAAEAREWVDAAMKPKRLYEETYRSPGLRIKAEFLPTLPSATPGYEVVDAYVLKSGKAEIDGEIREYQDVRIYLRKSAEPSPVYQHCPLITCRLVGECAQRLNCLLPEQHLLTAPAGKQP